MKKILSLMILMLAFGLVFADSFDSVLSELYSSGSKQYIGGRYYWVAYPKNFDDYDATDWVSWAATLFLFGQAGWDTTNISKYNSMLNSCDGVGAYWFDDDGRHLLTISLSNIKSAFNKDRYRYMDFDELADEIFGFVDKNGYYFGN